MNVKKPQPHHWWFAFGGLMILYAAYRIYKTSPKSTVVTGPQLEVSPYMLDSGMLQNISNAINEVAAQPWPTVTQVKTGGSETVTPPHIVGGILDPPPSTVKTGRGIQ